MCWFYRIVGTITSGSRMASAVKQSIRRLEMLPDDRLSQEMAEAARRIQGSGGDRWTNLLKVVAYYRALETHSGYPAGCEDLIHSFELYPMRIRRAILWSVDEAMRTPNVGSGGDE